ncbi:MAG: glycosyltransferase family 2 protein [Solirubrobacteraceae bacterium]
MPKVSIAIPAFRPQFLDACVASALAQTFRDFELLIGDDCPNEDVASVLAKWRDPRIRYLRNPNRGAPGSNRDMLISEASGQYLKFLFDDDLLLPPSIETLCLAADATTAKLVFHANYVIDAAGRTQQPPLALPEGQAAQLDRELMFKLTIGPATNIIGGPVNTLISLDALRAMSMPFGIDGNRMRFLTDMALYMNLVDQGPIVGTGNRLSGFRVHAGQASAESSPIFAAGVFEWEYLARWAADHWPIEYTTCVSTIEARHRWYSHFPRFPELQRFSELGAQPDDSGKFLSAGFLTVLEACWANVDNAGSLVAPGGE